MPSGKRPPTMAPPPVPPRQARRQIVELCAVRSALSEVHRLFNLYATASGEEAAASRERAEWWRDQHEKQLLRACGDVRSAIADAACRRFPSFVVTSRQLESVLNRAQTARR
jgi:hypothetical protein